MRTLRHRARSDRPAAPGPPVLAWRGWDTALTAALTTTAGHRRTPPRTTGRADPTTAQATALPDHAETVSPVTGTRHPLPGPGATTTARPARTGPPDSPGVARPPPGALLDAGPGTGWRCGHDPGDTGRVAWDDRAWSAFALGHARNQRCAQQPNAKSVSERIWQKSHRVRPNLVHVLRTLVSQAPALQKVVRPFHGYNAWQMSQHVRPNTLATP